MVGLVFKKDTFLVLNFESCSHHCWKQRLNQWKGVFLSY